MRLGGMKMGLVLAGLAVGTAGGGARAAGSDGQFALRGLGGAQCTTLTSAVDGNKTLRESLATWISGYLSGVNQTQADTFDVIPLQNPLILAALVEAACRQNPDVTVQGATGAIVQKLDAGRAHHASEMLRLGDAAAPVSIRSEVLAFVQDRLAAMGLMAAAASPGTFDAATQAALKTFQGSVNLPASGLPDDPTLLMLLSQD